MTECCWTSWATSFFTLAGFLSFAVYFLTLLVQNVLDFVPVNLKKKYNASWALVTGGSSGIGRAIVEKLAGQGINVVIVALPDATLDSFVPEISAKFPKLSFRNIGVSLAVDGFMEPIIEACKDIDVQLVFNNAGFVTLGFFHDLSLSRHLANYNTNSTCSLPITHYFLNKMIEKQQKGLISFTSSCAAFFPNPMSTMYSSTKAFLTMFATSLAPEIKSYGIDVVVVHPSPMATNFFNSAPNISAINFFKKFANKPSVIADVIFSSAGRFTVRDQGLITIFFKLLFKIVDFNFLSEIITRVAHTSADYKALKPKQQQRQSQKNKKE